MTCPQCKDTNIAALAREGEIQRFQCGGCSKVFTGPSLPEEAKPEEVRPIGVAHAMVLPPDPAEAPARPAPPQEEQEDGLPRGKCPKCGKPYFRLGKRFEEHVAACNGTHAPPISTPLAKDAERAKEPAAAAPTIRAFELSIEALKAQRSALEGEIRSINAAIATIERIKGLGSGPDGPFGGGA